MQGRSGLLLPATECRKTWPITLCSIVSVRTWMLCRWIYKEPVERKGKQSLGISLMYHIVRVQGWRWVMFPYWLKVNDKLLRCIVTSLYYDCSGKLLIHHKCKLLDYVWSTFLKKFDNFEFLKFSGKDFLLILKNLKMSIE